MPEFRVLLTDRAWPDWDVERELLAAIDAELIEPPDSEPETLVRFAAGVDAIGTCWAPVTAAMVQAAPHCRVISRFGIGLDNIDIAAATAQGIVVTNVPDYCVEEVSDHALALLMAAARNVAFWHHRAKVGEYVREAAPPMRRLAGRTLGLVGFGPIARRTRQKALALGLNVIACSVSSNDYGTGCPMVPLDELLSQSDFVSLHAPLTPDTRQMIGAEELRRMPEHAVLINTSRGGLVDHEALARAIDEQSIAGAALDVFDPEPPDLQQLLYRDERVIVTPHAAFLSVESLHELRLRAARQIVDVLSGRRPPHAINAVGGSND